ncbi:MAG: VOC family protein [Planctomycetaceae bacterium]|nr:VOC family protein [Planctomycetaceae bacterium]
MTMKLGPLHEIILYVRDMPAQVAFYRDVLGLEISSPAGLDDYSEQYWVVFETGQCSLALHGGGEQRFGEDAPKFVFKADDIEQVRDELLARNVSVSEIHSPSPGVQVADCKDPEGNVFSIESVS